ncbi:hypothetical protein FE251_09590 [Georgenia wutianyii]|uniref:Uncharacterized protein n=1 Tax=Georgenia wutianyii TaxID=2585135 RepID=A0ABX5VP42_9MICO|nr:hypothetical protein FE251_09590 [Georgenia wutianyii]
MPGRQSASLPLTAELARAGIAGSIGTVGDALPDALWESAIGLFKNRGSSTVDQPGRTTPMSRRPLQIRIERADASSSGVCRGLSDGRGGARLFTAVKKAFNARAQHIVHP